MIKNIFFLHRFHFNKSYYNSDDFQYLKDQGYNVKYLDLVGMLKSSKIEDTCPVELKNDVVYIDTRTEFKNFLKKYENTSLLLTCVGLQVNSAWFYRIISKSKIPYVFLDVDFFPKLNSKNKVKSISTKVKRVFEKIAPLYLLKKMIKSFDYYYTGTILRSTHTVIHVKSPVRRRIRKICNNKSKFIITNSKDWNAAHVEGDKPRGDNPYMVFIDQYIPYHPDFVSRGIDLRFTPEEYYSQLNKALAKISELTGFEVRIAAHPRRMNEGDYDFPLSYNETASLVKYSSLVLAHYSTAVNFAAVHNKPLAFLTSDLLQRSYIGTSIADMAHTFSKKPLDISDGNMGHINKEELLSVDNLVYESFIKENLFPENSNSASIGEIINEIIQNDIVLSGVKA